MLDLDKLDPKPYKVILRGKEIEVYPAKIRATMEIERYFKELGEMKGDEAIERAFAILTPLIPALEDKTLDFTIEQLLKIMQLVYRGEEAEPKKESTKKKIVEFSYLVAYFLRKFPGYTYQTLLNEYASVFWCLLEQSYKLDAGDKLEDIQVLSLPNLKEASDRKNIINQYIKQAKGKEEVDKNTAPRKSQLLGSDKIIVP